MAQKLKIFLKLYCWSIFTILSIFISAVAIIFMGFIISTFIYELFYFISSVLSLFDLSPVSCSPGDGLETSHVEQKEPNVAVSRTKTDKIIDGTLAGTSLILTGHLARLVHVAGNPGMQLGAALVVGGVGVSLVLARNMQGNAIELEGGVSRIFKSPSTIKKETTVEGAYGSMGGKVTTVTETPTVVQPQQGGWFSNWFGSGSNKSNFCSSQLDQSNVQFDNAINYLDNYILDLDLDIDLQNQLLLNNLSSTDAPSATPNIVTSNYLPEEIDMSPNVELMDPELGHLLDSEALSRGYEWLINYYLHYSDIAISNPDSQFILLHHLFCLILFIHLWVAISMVIIGEQIRGFIVQNKDHYLLDSKWGKYLIKYCTAFRLGYRGVGLMGFMLFITLLDYRYTLVRSFGIICENLLGGN